MGTNRAPLVADLFLFCYDDKQTDVIGAFNATSTCLYEILNIIMVYFDNLEKVNTSNTEASFLELHFSFSYDIVLPKFTINVTIFILKL